MKEIVTHLELQSTLLGLLPGLFTPQFPKNKMGLKNEYQCLPQLINRFNTAICNTQKSLYFSYPLVFYFHESLQWDTNELCMLILGVVLTYNCSCLLIFLSPLQDSPCCLALQKHCSMSFPQVYICISCHNYKLDASAVLCNIWGVPRESAVYCLTFSGGLENFTPPVVSLVISTVRYCALEQICMCSIITEHLEMNSLWLLLGVTLSRATHCTQSWWMMVEEDLSELGHSQELQFVSVDNLHSPERLLI